MYSCTNDFVVPTLSMTCHSNPCKCHDVSIHDSEGHVSNATHYYPLFRRVLSSTVATTFQQSTITPYTLTPNGRTHSMMLTWQSIPELLLVVHSKWDASIIFCRYCSSMILHPNILTILTSTHQNYPEYPKSSVLHFLLNNSALSY